MELSCELVDIHGGSVGFIGCVLLLTTMILIVEGVCYRVDHDECD